MKCNYCGSENLEKILSVTNSTYHYCKECDNGLTLTNKHLVIDKVLNKLLCYIKALKKRGLKIEITEDNGSILLYINNKKVLKTKLTHRLTDKDIYYLENIVHELVQDHYEFNPLDVDIIVCA